MSELQRSPPGSGSGREAFLAIVLCGLVGIMGLVFLVFVTNGLFAWVVLIAIGMALFGGLHYLIWGRRFEESIAAERAALLAAEEESASPRRETSY